MEIASRGVRAAGYGSTSSVGHRTVDCIFQRPMLPLAAGFNEGRPANRQESLSAAVPSETFATVPLPEA